MEDRAAVDRPLRVPVRQAEAVGAEHLVPADEHQAAAHDASTLAAVAELGDDALPGGREVERVAGRRAGGSARRAVLFFAVRVLGAALEQMNEPLPARIVLGRQLSGLGGQLPRERHHPEFAEDPVDAETTHVPEVNGSAPLPLAGHCSGQGAARGPDPVRHCPAVSDLGNHDQPCRTMEVESRPQAMRRPR